MRILLIRCAYVSQNIQNALLLDRFIAKVQTKILALEASELQELKLVSLEEAIKVTLKLTTQPLPVMPDYEMQSELKADPEKLTDVIDDILENGYMEENGKGDGGAKNVNEIAISDTEALKTCKEWMSKYNVKMGVNWGGLPEQLQYKWMGYSCDYHLTKDAESKDKDGEGDSEAVGE